MPNSPLDLELAAVLARFTSDSPTDTGPLTVESIRASSDLAVRTFGALAPVFPQVERREFTMIADDGVPVRLVWFSSTEAETTGSAVVHAHGGGLVSGSVDLFAPFVSRYVARSGVPFLSVEYRLVPEVSGDRPVRDVFNALTWLHEHACELGVDPQRIGVFGESAGGTLAAGTAILAREHAVPLQKQILVYPMLDDRTGPNPPIAPYASWSHAGNEVVWDAVLGSGARSAPVVPGRLVDASGLASAYIDVGTLDLFCGESIAYAEVLKAAGVEVELQVYDGVMHGFDQVAPDIEVSRRAFANRVRVLSAL
ncbi:alpha/beta hydrolase [Kineosporia babensis]|uniref:Alpha/beta hydrolase n=1 Tax=Kineosporia babensis TaxID=499548 RepID=A0A9X1T2C5_9ACTN|nr:alpha/beta hydrolase [Kineosporia babensis]MCD5314503.1 alpha/beta hydrolase [Kineosporia babensis]